MLAPVVARRPRERERIVVFIASKVLKKVNDANKQIIDSLVGEVEGWLRALVIIRLQR